MTERLEGNLAKLSATDRALLRVVIAGIVELSEEGNDWLEEYVWDGMDERIALDRGAA